MSTQMKALELAEEERDRLYAEQDTINLRIIQVAESGLFLKRVQELLMGADGFYDGIFRAMTTRIEVNNVASPPAAVTARASGVGQGS